MDKEKVLLVTPEIAKKLNDTADYFWRLENFTFEKSNIGSNFFRGVSVVFSKYSRRKIITLSELNKELFKILSEIKNSSKNYNYLLNLGEHDLGRVRALLYLISEIIKIN